eukprot:442990-Prymnesium_polylepis.1
MGDDALDEGLALWRKFLVVQINSFAPRRRSGRVADAARHHQQGTPPPWHQLSASGCVACVADRRTL